MRLCVVCGVSTCWVLRLRLLFTRFILFMCHQRGAPRAASEMIVVHVTETGYPRGISMSMCAVHLDALHKKKFCGLLPSLSRHRNELPSTRVCCVGVVWRLGTSNWVIK